MKSVPLLFTLALAGWVSAAASAVLPLFEDGGAALRRARDLAWLAQDSLSAPPALWPRRPSEPGQDPDPRLGWTAQRRGPRGLPADAPLAQHPGDLELALCPVLTVGRWSSDNAVLEETGNGLDLEARFLDHLGVQFAFRDAGLEGDLGARQHPAYEPWRTWLWQEVAPEGNSLTHDETRARLLWAAPLGRRSILELGLSRDQPIWGPGLLGGVILRGEQTPALNRVHASLASGPLTFTTQVAELESRLLDSLAIHPDPVEVREPWRQKWLVGHRVEWTGRHGALGLGELVVVGDELPGLGYLNPVNFLWSEQHAAGDRDNTLIFVDARLRLPRILPGRGQLHGELCLDDYTLGDLGSSAEGQKTATLLGLAWSPPTGLLGTGPTRSLWLIAEQRRIRPWFGSHFHQINAYSHGSQSLLGAQPNSRLLDLALCLDQALPAARLAFLGLEPGLLGLDLEGGHSRHGANPPGLNIGGSLDLAHRWGIDPDEVDFLAGTLERLDYRRLRLSLAQPLRLHARSRSLPFGVLTLETSLARWHGYGLAPGGETVREFALAWTLGGTPR